jgi:ubiquitin-conjugating enzyme E2 J1
MWSVISISTVLAFQVSASESNSAERIVLGSILVCYHSNANCRLGTVGLRYRRPHLLWLKGGSQETDQAVCKIALKRIPRELKDLDNNPPGDFRARPTERNILDWHFVFSGLEGSDYEGGFYHGRLLLSPNYPLAPPKIIMYTENGRFSIEESICLSITHHHPEDWQASWTIRTCITALRLFMGTNERGIGSIETSSETRHKHAKNSHSGLTKINSEAGSPNYNDLLELHRNLHQSLKSSLKSV